MFFPQIPQILADVRMVWLMRKTFSIDVFPQISADNATNNYLRKSAKSAGQ